MGTKREKLALFNNVKHNYSIPLRYADGDDMVRGDEWVRITEFVDVEFTELPVDVVAEATKRGVTLTRERLQRELAALDGAK